jgi:CheY-like chemotaxis protein
MAKEKKRVMVVDDEYFIGELIKMRLEVIGYEVDIAESGQQCLDMLAKKSVDCILMDVMMPAMSGWETTKLIKADEKLKSIPVIFLTALSRHEDHLKAQEVGGDDYISKPFEIQDLLAKVKQWTEK